MYTCISFHPHKLHIVIPFSGRRNWGSEHSITAVEPELGLLSVPKPLSQSTNVSSIPDGIVYRLPGPIPDLMNQHLQEWDSGNWIVKTSWFLSADTCYSGPHVIWFHFHENIQNRQIYRQSCCRAEGFRLLRGKGEWLLIWVQGLFWGW